MGLLYIASLILLKIKLRLMLERERERRKNKINIIYKKIFNLVQVASNYCFVFIKFEIYIYWYYLTEK